MTATARRIPQEFRAYPVVNDMPLGHIVVRINNVDHYPYLRNGDRVLVDTTDRVIEYGELYLVLDGTQGGRIWQIRRDTKSTCAFLCRLSDPSRNSLINASIYLDGLEEILAGRVVALFEARPFVPPTERGDVA